MSERQLEGRVALVVGGGQTPGETIGNGRATAIEFARQGATVLVGDIRLDSARETVALIEGEGGRAAAANIDVTDEAGVRGFMGLAVERWQRVLSLGASMLRDSRVSIHP